MGDLFTFFPWDAVKVSTMIQKGAVQTTCCFWCWFLVMIILFVILRKRSRNKNVKTKIYHMSQSFKKIGGGSVHIFSMGCCKSVHYDSKGCCSNNIVFLMFPLHYSKVIYLIQFAKQIFWCKSQARAKKKHLSIIVHIAVPFFWFFRML